jgi:hypothetical protein
VMSWFQVSNGGMVQVFQWMKDDESSTMLSKWIVFSCDKWHLVEGGFICYEVLKLSWDKTLN